MVDLNQMSAAERAAYANGYEAGQMSNKIYPGPMSGDRLEFEKEWEGKDPKLRPDWPLPSFDAKDWAEAFCKQHPERISPRRYHRALSVPRLHSR